MRMLQQRRMLIAPRPPAVGKPTPLLSISTENAYIVAVLGLCNVVTPLFLFEKTVCVWGETFQFIDGNSVRMVGDLPKVQALIIFYLSNTIIPHGFLVLGYWGLNLR